jgi:hypothetical protein
MFKITFQGAASMVDGQLLFIRNNTDQHSEGKNDGSRFDTVTKTKGRCLSRSAENG